MCLSLAGSIGVPAVVVLQMTGMCRHAKGARCMSWQEPDTGILAGLALVNRSADRQPSFGRKVVHLRVTETRAGPLDSSSSVHSPVLYPIGTSLYH